ncbi:flavin reductase [Roseomonas chloroacetimidivorans]|uniref:flavin reductase n=1 Tax=Roseomonas chloroacetimidivorans TaxID=1766656 RepID=UPI003C70EFD4
MVVASAAFRNAMARLGAAVNVVTTDGPAGRAGITASAVCSVTDTPPTLLVCLNRGSASHAVFSQNGVLCVNTLSFGQRGTSDLFAGRTGLPAAQRFEGVQWERLATGAPVLSGTVASFDCRIVDCVTRGTHSVLFAEVEAIVHGEVADGGLIYFGRGYHQVGAAVLTRSDAA